MAGESIAVAIYKLGMENQQYIAAAKAAAQAGDQLVAANTRVAQSEEKAGGASKLRANFIEAELSRFDRAQKAQDLYARQIARVAQAEQEGLSTAARRQQLLDQYSSQLNKTITDLERKAKAERDAVQAERDAEAAAKNLARIESEHALALKNVATALGQDRDALIAAANAGNRHASATLDMMNKIVGLNKELQNGKINLAGHAAEIDRVQAAYRNQTGAIAQQEAAMRKSSTITGLARHELINLSRQLQDIGVSLAGGQSPFRILIEQGSQIADIFASSRAAFGETFRNLILWVGRAAGSITGIITIVTALGAAAGALALNWLEGQRAIEKALTGIGERAGVSVAQVQKMAEAASANTRLSTNAARESAAEFIKTGKIYGENISLATNLTDKFALAMGVSASEGAKQLADILSDVNKGAMTLDKSFGFLDGATRELISSLVIQNRQQEAIALLMQKAEPAITKAANAASVYAKAWMAVTKAISDSIEVTGRAIAKGIEFEASRPDPGRQRQGSPGRVMAMEMRGQLPVSAEAVTKATKAVEAYEQALNEAAAAAVDSRFREFGLAADDAVKSMFPQIEQLKILRKALEDLKRAQEEARISGGQGLAPQNQAAINALELQIRLQEEGMDKSKRQVEEVLKVAAAYKNVSVETALTLRELDNQLNIAKAVTVQEKLIAQEKARTAQLTLAGTKATEAAAIASKERLVAETQIATQHKLNTAALEDQLRVAQALPGHAQQVAQEEATINALLREGFTLMQAQEQAALQRAIAVEQANRAVDQQIISLRQGVEMERARLEGTEAATAAAHAYANAMRSGASETKAAALAAATLEANLERAQIAAEQMANSIAAAGPAANSLAGKLASIGTEAGAKGRSFSGGSFINQTLTPIYHGVALGGPLVGAAGMSTALSIDVAGRNRVMEIMAKALEAQAESLRQKTPEEYARAQEEAARAAQDAARAQEQAARDAQDAAKAQAEAAKAAREARISQLDEAVADIVATKLLAGQSAQAVNMLIETGAIQFGTASTRFQTQLDLYKRAGASNAQTAADIRAGIIGEGARPSELLAALDSLTDAVDANTEAQLGLSPFYTSQGDRQLGYRGYTVQKGLSNIPGTEVGGSTTGIPGTGTGTGTQYPYSPGTGGGIMGGIVNDPGTVSYSGGFGGSGYQSGTYVGNGWAVLPDGNWVYLASGTVVEAGTNKILGTVDTYKSGFYATWWPGGGTRPTSTTTSALPRSNYTGVWHAAEGGIMSAYGPISLRSYQDGGIANGPTMRQFGQQMAMFGEAGPEAFVPLKGGAIPVRIMREPGAANENRPQNVVNITAPLVYFATEPTRDEVRESAFQAAQMLRRMAMGG